MIQREPQHTVYRFIQRNGEIIPIIINDDGEEQEVVWAPQPGSQAAFLECDTIEVLLEGNRGGGKTDVALMDFYQDVGKGWGADWVGVLIRQTHPMLRDVIERSKKLFKKLCPTATYNEIKYMWEFPGGERLYFSHFNESRDFDNFLGHQYAWICWEELTRWPNDTYYKQMFSVLRSTRPGMPRKIRATTNPYGVGHGWVRERFKLFNWPQSSCKLPECECVKSKSGRRDAFCRNYKSRVLGDLIEGKRDPITGIKEADRRVIHNELSENRLLRHTDPEYLSRIKQSARNKSEEDAWVLGSWDITAGGMFDDIWGELRDTIQVPQFDVPFSWIIFRALDWGSAKPFSVGYYAVSDGTDLMFPDGKVRATVRGDIFRVGEIYGWTGQKNEGKRSTVTEIVREMITYELKRGWRMQDGKRGRVKRGPADTGIFDVVNDNCIANDFEKKVRWYGIEWPGIVWERADKGPGSREQGWEQMRRRMLGAKRPPGGYREVPGLFVMLEGTWKKDANGVAQFLQLGDNHWVRTVPELPRDEKKPDDVDTDAEDHVADECRYALRYEGGWFKRTSGRVGGT